MSKSPQRYLPLYNRLGFKLVAIHPGTKKPVKKNWQKKTKSDKIKKGQNFGLKHAYSGLCCFDIDNLLELKKIEGGYWKTIKKGIKYTSGKDNRLKILFRVKKPFRTIPLSRGAGELRCATATGYSVQDLLPGSTLDDGREYKFIDESWKNWVPFDKTLKIPHLPKKIQKELNESFRERSKGPGRYSAKYLAPYVKAYNAWFLGEGKSLGDMILAGGGYQPVKYGYSRYGSQSGSVNIIVDSDEHGEYGQNFSPERPVGGEWIPYGAFDPYDLYVLLVHNGDEELARKAVCNHPEIKLLVNDYYNEFYTEELR